jgi:hypothetical protein
VIAAAKDSPQLMLGPLDSVLVRCLVRSHQLGLGDSGEGLMQTPGAKSRSLCLAVSWVAGVIISMSCSEQYEPRASPIVSRRLGGDSMVPGALIKGCEPEDEGCVPTNAVACSVIWMGDPAQKPNMPLSPEEEAWCVAQGQPVRR